MSHKQLTLFGKVLKDVSAIYANPTSKYEEFVECWYQCNKHEIIRDAQVH